RCARQIQPQRLPMIAVVKGYIDGRFAAGKEQTLLFGILSNDVQLTARAFLDRQTIHDARPGLAAVVRAIDVVLLRARLSWTTTKTDVGKDVGRMDIAVSGFNSDEARARRKIGEVRDVVPGLAAIERVVDLSVGAARPHDALLDCRDREI